MPSNQTIAVPQPTNNRLPSTEPLNHHSMLHSNPSLIQPWSSAHATNPLHSQQLMSHLTAQQHRPQLSPLSPVLQQVHNGPVQVNIHHPSLPHHTPGLPSPTGLTAFEVQMHQAKVAQHELAKAAVHQELQLQKAKEIQLHHAKEIQHAKDIEHIKELQLQRAHDIQMQQAKELQQVKELQYQQAKELHLQRAKDVHLQRASELQMQQVKELRASMVANHEIQQQAKLIQEQQLHLQQAAAAHQQRERQVQQAQQQARQVQQMAAQAAAVSSHQGAPLSAFSAPGSSLHPTPQPTAPLSLPSPPLVPMPQLSPTTLLHHSPPHLPPGIAPHLPPTPQQLSPPPAAEAEQAWWSIQKPSPTPTLPALSPPLGGLGSLSSGLLHPGLTDPQYHALLAAAKPTIATARRCRRCRCPNCQNASNSGTPAKRKQHICHIPGCGKVSLSNVQQCTIEKEKLEHFPLYY